MNIEAFVNAKRQMEQEIHDAVLAATFKFWGETGYTPNSISIDLLPKVAINSKKMQYVVGRVQTKVDVE